MHITTDLHIGPGLQRFTAQILFPVQGRGRRTVLGHGRSLVVYGLVVGQVQRFQILFGTFAKALPKGFMQRLKRNNPGRPNQRPDNRRVGDRHTDGLGGYAAGIDDCQPVALSQVLDGLPVMGRGVDDQGVPRASPWVISGSPSKL